jgi:hypothetical protein
MLASRCFSLMELGVSYSWLHSPISYCFHTDREMEMYAWLQCSSALCKELTLT